jgi:hypothetical protein
METTWEITKKMGRAKKETVASHPRGGAPSILVLEINVVSAEQEEFRTGDLARPKAKTYHP